MENKGGRDNIIDALSADSDIQKKADIHSALSDPLRLKILDILKNQSMCVCLIKEITDISDSKLSYHLSILKNSGLIGSEKQGNWIIYFITDTGRRYM